MGQEYFRWLITSIDPRKIIGRRYQPVLKELFHTDFRWTDRFRDDENRARDGLALRERFAEERGIRLEDLDFYEKPCSCLEMMIALARRIEYEILALPGEENVPRWFWTFMGNMGLMPEDERTDNLDYVDGTIERWLDRKYERSGYGGIFVVGDRYFDMRKMTIWKQMTAVLNEVIEF